MRVYIDQNLCTGCGLCPEIASSVFTMQDDGLAYVQDFTGIKRKPGELADVPKNLEDAVEEAESECPGCCILTIGD